MAHNGLVHVVGILDLLSAVWPAGDQHGGVHLWGGWNRFFWYGWKRLVDHRVVKVGDPLVIAVYLL